jgi:alpha-1,2-mannosyltransferase
MIASPESTSEPRVSPARLTWFASIVFCGVLPAIALVALFVATVQDDTVAIDFRQFYVAGEAIAHGESPYSESDPALWGGPYPYPPLPAQLVMPLIVLPFQVAGLIVMAILVLVALAVLFVVGVHDWRCYGLVLLWPPVISAIQTGNVTLWLALALALAWRFRDRLLASSTSLGVTLAVKFFLWPVLVWMVATRRYAAAVVASVVGAGLLLGSWAAIGFDGMRAYPDLVQRLEDTVGEDSYTAYIVGLDVGLSSTAARSLWLALGLGLLALVVLLGRRGEERAAFILAIATALSLTPIVWLHYFALLVVVVALAQPRLGIVWFVPFGMVLTPGSGHPTPFETSVTLVVAAVTIALAVRAAWASDARDARHPSTSPVRA